MIVEKSLDNLKKCLCMKCPSYSNHCKLKNAPDNFIKLMRNFNDTKHYEKMFCAYEKSDCIFEANGCLCASCEVFKTYNLKHQNYCLHTGGIA